MPSWVYMLRCADGSFYTGCTTHIERRIAQHHGGETGGYTATRRPLELLWCEEFQNLDDAIASERQIKGWGRAKKLALINRDYERIRELGLRGGKAGASFETDAARPPQDDADG